MKTNGIAEAVAFASNVTLGACVIIAIVSFAFHEGKRSTGPRAEIVAPANMPCVSVCRTEDGFRVANITRVEARPTYAPTTVNVLDGGVR